MEDDEFEEKKEESEGRKGKRGRGLPKDESIAGARGGRAGRGMDTSGDEAGRPSPSRMMWTGLGSPMDEDCMKGREKGGTKGHDGEMSVGGSRRCAAGANGLVQGEQRWVKGRFRGD